MGYSSDMPSFPGLQRTASGRYRLRRVVPEAIRHIIGSGNRTQSLMTHDPREAIKLAKLKSAEIDAEFDRAWAQLSDEGAAAEKRVLTVADIERLVLTVKHEMLEQDDQCRLLGDADGLEQGEAAQDALYSELRRAIATGNYRAVHRITDSVMEDNGYTNIDKNDLSFLKARRAIAEAMVQAWDDTNQRVRGIIVPTPAMPRVGSDGGGRLGTNGPPTVRSASKEFIKDHEKRWADKTRDDYQSKLDLFIAVVGDVAVNEVQREDGLHFREVISKLPANWMKKPVLRGLSAIEAADRAASSRLKPMSDTNVSKYVTRVGQLFNWCATERDHWGVSKNPLRRLQIKTNVMARDERSPFANEQLRAIFNAPLYSGLNRPGFAGG